MEPLTITGFVLKAVATSLSTAKMVHDVYTRYRDAPTTIMSISSEISVTSASLSQIQALLVPKQSQSHFLDERPEVAQTLDSALTGCMVVFSCLYRELQRTFARNSDSGNISWKGKTRILWNYHTLEELLSGLRGQNQAITLLIQLLQMDELIEIRRLVEQNKPVLSSATEKVRSLRESNPDINVPESIYDFCDREGSKFSVDINSNAAPSDLEFDFDDLVVSSRAYRRVMYQKLAASREVPISEDTGGFFETDNVIHAPFTEAGTNAAVQLNHMPSAIRLRNRIHYIVRASHLEIAAFRYNREGRWDEATNSWRQVMHMQRTILGDEHKDTLRSMQRLGYALYQQYNDDEAEKILRLVVEGRKRVLGDEGKDTLSSMALLGEVLEAQRKFKEAENLLQATIEVQKRVLGSEDKDTLWSMASLGLTLQRQGKLKEAEKLLQRTVKVQKRVLGDEDKDTLWSMALLGKVLEVQGKFKEAENLLQATVEVRKRVLGHEHQDTLDNMWWLGATLCQQDKHGPGLSLMKRACDGFAKTLGPKDPRTVRYKQQYSEWLATRPR